MSVTHNDSVNKTLVFDNSVAPQRFLQPEYNQDVAQPLAYESFGEYDAKLLKRIRLFQFSISVAKLERRSEDCIQSSLLPFLSVNRLLGAIVLSGVGQ